MLLSLLFVSYAVASPLRTTSASLPGPQAFQSDKGAKWTLEPVPRTNASQNLGNGAIFSSTINRLGWDKGRTSSIDGRAFWNFGDVLSADGIAVNPSVGFSMGAAFYASTANPLEVNMTGIYSVSNEDFAKPWTGQPDPDPVPPQGQAYGMDTSNIAQTGPGEGIGFGWEIFRSTEWQNVTNLGNAIFRVTLGASAPVATRERGLITGGDKIQIGLMTTLNPNLANSPSADGYIYMYSMGVGIYDSVIVGRVPVTSAFDPTKYQFLKQSGEWDAEGVIPIAGDTSYGMAGKPVSNSQGSIFYNQYLGKYMLFYGTDALYGGFYLGDTPVGPWGEGYGLLSSGDGQMRYGVNVHPELSPDQSGKELYVSWGTPGVITMYRLSFGY